MTAPLSGRKAQAARNDEVILHAARAVFVADPTAPISAVAERAGVGISALYRRYPSKEDLLRTLCGDGLRAYLEVAEAALADTALDPWQAFVSFMRAAVEADTSSLTTALAGTFTPTQQMYADAARAGELNERLWQRAQPWLRPDVTVNDLAMIFEQVAAIKIGDEHRRRQLRQRALTLILDGMHCPPVTSELPAPAPTNEELTGRWG